MKISTASFRKKALLAGKYLFPFLAAAAFLAVWAIAAAAVGREYVLPSVGATFRALGRIMKEDFVRRTLATLLRALEAFAISLVLAAALCALTALIPGFDRFLSPLVTVLRAVPTISVIMFALIWLDSLTAPLVIASLVLLPMLYAAFRASLEGVDPALVGLAAAYRVPRAKRIFRLYLPCMLPSAFAAARSNAGLSVKLVVAAEVLSQTGRDLGIGVSMQTARYVLDTAGLLAWTLVAVLLSALLETAVWLIGKAAIKGGAR